MSRRIAVITGSRAEYGLLAPLLRQLIARKGIEAKLIVSAAHLSAAFGSTKDAILSDGFAIDAEVEMLAPGDDAVATAKSVGLGCIGFADVLKHLAPDLVVLLGDRFETLAAAETAMLLRIPVAHLHGGEATEGAIDDSIRHAITKMSHLHFVAAQEHAKRVIQLGEHPDRVFNVGAIGLDAARVFFPMTRDELEQAFGIPADDRIILVTMHPETLSNASARDQIRPLLNVLGKQPAHTVVISYPNADFGGREMIAEIDAFASGRKNVTVKSHFGQRGYLSLLAAAEAVVGNSSSGIIEAPSFKTPTINIGNRQKGRLRAASVLDCAGDEGAIAAALERALSIEFQSIARTCVNPYGDGQTAPRIAKVLSEYPLHGLLQKSFYALPWPDDVVVGVITDARPVLL